MQGMTFEEVKCMQDEKKPVCLVDTDPDLFYDTLDFMRYFDRPAQDLEKEGKLKLAPSKAIPGFK